VDKKKILAYLSQLDTYYQRLEKNIPAKFKDYNKNLILKGFCERTLQTLIEICIDITNFIIKEEKLGLPSEEEDIFKKLQQDEIISKEITSTLRNMKKFRNVLIHRYVEVKDELVHDYAVNQRSDFMKFKKEILQYLKK